MEQMWQKRLTFDGILGVLQKHMEKFEIFITYSSHLQELSSVISGAKVKKSEVATQAYSNLYSLERVYLPLLHLTVIRKILQQMRGVLEVTNSHLDHFHCKRTLSRITEVLEDCYKVLATASDSTFVSSLDKKLNECCDASTRVTFPEVFKKSEMNSNSSTSKSLVNKENEVKQKSNIIVSLQSRDVHSRTSSSLKSSQQKNKNANVSKGNVLTNKLNSVINVRDSNVSEKLKSSSAESRVPAAKSESNLTEIVREKVPKLRSTAHKTRKASLSSKVASSEKRIIMDSKRISIVDIPLYDNDNSERSGLKHANELSYKSEKNLSTEVENNNEMDNKDNISKTESLFLEKNTIENKASNSESQDLYEENTTNSDHSGSSRSTLYGGSRHDSSSECTLNEYDISGSTENDPSMVNVSVKKKSQKVGNERAETEDNLYYDTSPEYALYFNKELYCSASGDAHCGEKKKVIRVLSDETTDNNYDYVYVTDSQSSSQMCECVTCTSKIKMHEEGSHDNEYNATVMNSQYLSHTESSVESNSNSDTDDNIYEDVHYVDMNSQGQDSEVTTIQDYDSDSNDNYDDIDIYVKPDAGSIRSSSERSRYSSDSGNLEDGSNAYYNSLQSVQKSCSPSSTSCNPCELLDELHDESDSAIESGSDTGRLHNRKVCRTPSNASLSLQNMVRWRNAQPATPLRPRRELPAAPLEAPFDDAPLYQEYYRALPAKINEKEVKQNTEEEKTYICMEPQEHVYETLDEYLVSRDMIPITDTFKRKDKRERSDSRRTQWHETEEVVESGLLDGMSTEERKLQEAKFEIVTSEVSFLKSLNILEKYFINNSEVNNKDILCEEDRRTLFMPIVPVKETSQCFLQDLVKVWEDDIYLKNSELAEVLIKYAKGRFRVYIAYCSRQVDINVVLSQLREKNRKFIEVIEKIEAKPVCQAFTLQSFLTQPMQRITRFPMLVMAILRHLPEGDESIASWKKVLSTLQAVVTECNEAVRNAEITLAQKKEDKKKTFWTKWVK